MWWNMYLYLLRIHYKKIRKGLIWWWLCNFFSDFLYKGICCGYSFELHRQVDAIQMRTHNICLYKKENKKYTGCNKTTEFHECALIGVCAVIRSNTVHVPEFTHWGDLQFSYVPTRYVLVLYISSYKAHFLLACMKYKESYYSHPGHPPLRSGSRHTTLSAYSSTVTYHRAFIFGTCIKGSKSRTPL